MKITTVTIKRGTGALSSQPIIASGIVAQIDQQSLDMQQFDHGAAPYDLFAIIAWTDQMQRNDHLIDADGLVYTVSARPEVFMDGHVECTATIPVGN